MMEKELLMKGETIRQAAKTLANRINVAVGDEPLLAVGILNGCYPFFTDLVSYLKPTTEVAFVQAASYGDKHVPGEVAYTGVVPLACFGKHVLLIDDIYDTGATMNGLVHQVREKDPISITAAVIIYKGITTPDVDMFWKCTCGMPGRWYYGYGMDYAGKYRNLPNIYSTAKER